MHLPWIFLSGLCLPPQDQIPPEEMRHTDIQVLGDGKCALRTLENIASSQAGTRSQTLPFLNRGGPAEVITILPRHSPAPRWHIQEIKPQEAIEYGLFLCFYVPSTFISCHFLQCKPFLFFTLPHFIRNSMLYKQQWSFSFY